MSYDLVVARWAGIPMGSHSYPWLGQLCTTRCSLSKVGLSLTLRVCRVPAVRNGGPRSRRTWRTQGFRSLQAVTLDATLADYLARKGSQETREKLGETIAAAYLPLRRLDPDPPTVFTSGTLPGEWHPTEPAFAPMFAPQASTFHPLTLTGPGRFRPVPPPELTDEQYTRDINEVKTLGALEGSTRTPAQRD